MTFVKFKNAGGHNTFPSLSRGYNFPSFFNDSLERIFTDETSNWLPLVNIKERSADFIIDLAVPGMDKQNFKIEVDNEMLTISGERKQEINDENEKHTRREFKYGSFTRSFSLPENADSENIAAAYNNGILQITIAKKETLKEKAKKEISVA